MVGKKQDRPPWVRHSGIGLEFAAALAGFTLVGIWVDRRYGCRPWGTVIGAVLGLTGGMYNLIRKALNAFPSDKRNGTDGQDEP